MGMHDGHRDRLKQQFRDHGLDTLHDINVLELLLFYTIPRQDTNVLAHRLLDRFGSLAGVMDASLEELCTVKGIGENTATLLKLIPQMDRRYRISKTAAIQQVCNSEDAGQLLVPKYKYARNEMVYLITLDNNRCLIDCEKIGEGTLGEATVPVRTIVERALLRNASAVVLSHNHVGSVALPSRADELATRQICEALRHVGIKLMDHIIVSDDDFVSFADSGLLNQFIC